MRVLLVLLTAVAVLVPASAASATFPGRDGGFAITHDGCQGGSEYVRLLDARGTFVRNLTPRCTHLGEGRYRDTFSPQWSPDGSRVLFADAGGPQGSPPSFRTIGAAGTGERTIGEPAYRGPRTGMDRTASFSPDGERIVYELMGNIYTASVDGGDERVVYRTPCPQQSYRCSHAIFSNPRWSPDGRLFLVQRTNCRPCSRDGLWTMSARTGRPVRQLVRGGYWPDWSPDSRWIVFAGTYSHDEITGHASGGNLYVVRADGRGKVRRVVHRERIAEISPVWSPDGRSIAWVSLRFGPGDVGFAVGPSLWRMSLRSGRPRKLRDLPSPEVEEGSFEAPHIAWRPLPR